MVTSNWIKHKEFEGSDSFVINGLGNTTVISSLYNVYHAIAWKILDLETPPDRRLSDSSVCISPVLCWMFRRQVDLEVRESLLV
jgi:hypothetical protein